MNIDFFRCDYIVDDITKHLHEIVKSKYNHAETLQIFEALALARSAHEMQFRGDNIPFIIHPMRVALMLVQFDRNITSKVFIAALLHDVLEDTNVTNSAIEEQFGKYVAKLVQSVTKHHKKTEDLQEKRVAKRQNWEEIILEDHEVRAIKTFEDLDNMIAWKAIPPKNPVQQKIPRWLEEAREMSLPLAHATNLQAYRIMQQEYSYYVAQSYAAQPITL
jgi:(p)ppGpp synthase/HD superfamily hydrolase